MFSLISCFMNEKDGGPLNLFQTMKGVGLVYNCNFQNESSMKGINKRNNGKIIETGVH